MNKIMNFIHGKDEDAPPPLPVRSPLRLLPKSPLRQILVENDDLDPFVSRHHESETNSSNSNDTDAYSDDHLESIDETIDQAQSLWPVTHRGSDASSYALRSSRSSPAILASPDDSSSIYSTRSEEYSSGGDTNEQTASLTTSSRASTSSDSIIHTPQSDTPPLSAKFAPYHKLTASPPSLVNSSYPDPESAFTTEHLFEMISQILTVDEIRSSTQSKTPYHPDADVAECYIFNYFPPSPVVRPLIHRSVSRASHYFPQNPAVRPLPDRSQTPTLPQRSSSRLSRTFSIRSNITTTNSIVDGQQSGEKPSSSSLLAMPKRMSSLRFPSISRRNVSP